MELELCRWNNAAEVCNIERYELGNASSNDAPLPMQTDNSA
jgi:hypothetical protein